VPVCPSVGYASVSWCEFSGNAARHGPVTRDTDTYILGQAGPQPYAQ
jgi:hypothetical protein